MITDTKSIIVEFDAMHGENYARRVENSVELFAAVAEFLQRELGEIASLRSRGYYLCDVFELWAKDGWMSYLFGELNTEDGECDLEAVDEMCGRCWESDPTLINVRARLPF